jgi:hypothetical protein
MKISMNCFKCKQKYEVDIKSDDVHTTSNNRYVANVKCATCERKMTSLIKREQYNNILKPETPVESS